jgi:hypothetical protein
MTLTAFYPLRGGLDLVTPPAEVAPGRVIAAMNYEPAERGYRRMDGYERFDGRFPPSEATYHVLSFTNGSTQINAGDIVRGASSGVAAVALRNATLESGSYGAGTAAGKVLLTRPLGAAQSDSFLDGGPLPAEYTLTRSSPGARINSSGNLVVEPANAPRYTYFWNGSGWAIAGLLVEDIAQNQIVSNDGTGGVAGSPGTLPTQWVEIDLRGLTRTLAFGTENGIHYTQIRLNGTPTSTGNVDIALALQAGISIGPGSYHFSAFLKLQAGSFANINPATSGLFLHATTGAPDFATVHASTFRMVGVVDGSPLSRQRYRTSIVVTNPDARHARPRYRIGVTSGQPVDITVRIGLPQVEVGKFGPTSPIRTSGAMAIRLPDVLTRVATSPVGARVTARRLDTFSLLVSDQVLPPVGLTGKVVMARSPQPLRQVLIEDLSPVLRPELEYAPGETLLVGLSSVATAAGAAQARGLIDPAEDQAAFEEAVEAARALIGPVPGEGPVRGAWRYNGQIYAFRDLPGGDEGAMYRATPAGWVREDLGHILPFRNGSVPIEEGLPITDGTATAVVERVVVRSGSWESGTAAGVLSLSNAQNAFVPGEPLSGNGAAVVAASQTAVKLAAGGRYRFVNHNFFGLAQRRRMYIVNGVNRAMEWNGRSMLPINTGLDAEIDKPTHLAVHQGALFLAYDGGSVQFSATGEPAVFTAIAGAGEVAIGTQVTGMVSGVVGSLPIFGRDRIAILFGEDKDNYRLEDFSNDSGAYDNSVELAGTPIYCDSRGLRQIVPSDTFGNFIRGSISRSAEPLFSARLRSGARPIAAVRVRSKDQYRLFWDDKPLGVFVYLGREFPELMPFELAHMPFATYSIDDGGGDETLLMAGQNGFVYTMDRGTSFDGQPIRAFIRFPFNNVGSTTQQKRFDKAILEIDSGPTTTIGFTAEISYGDPDYPAQAEQTLQTFSVAGGGGFWDSETWETFFWSSQAFGRATAFLAAIGENISFTIISEQAYERPHTLSGMTLHFQRRGLNR